MIDTIKLLLDRNQFEISDFDAFTPSAERFYTPPFYNIKQKCIRNCTKEELKQGLYYPQLTLFKKVYHNKPELFLLIEFSVPKLLLNNNFEEVNNADFEKILDILRKKLAKRNVLVSFENLKTAMVTSVHYSKNIELKSASSKYLINILNKIDVSKVIDIAKTDYRNDGIALRFHTNSYELTFYDKMADLQQSLISEKRAIEKDNLLQNNLLNDKDFATKEFFRIEVRLNKRKKIQNILEKCNIEENSLSFSELFSAQISQKILLYFWNKFVKNSLSTIILFEDSFSTLQEKMIFSGISKIKTFTMLGIIASLKERGIKLTKEILNTSNYSRYKKDFESIKNEENYLYRQFMLIESEINKMNPIKINNLYKRTEVI